MDILFVEHEPYQQWPVLEFAGKPFLSVERFAKIYVLLIVSQLHNLKKTFITLNPRGAFARSARIQRTKCEFPLLPPIDRLFNISKLVARNTLASVRILCTCEYSPCDNVFIF